MNVKKIRELFPITEKYIYFQNAGFTPCCTRVKDAITEYLQIWQDRYWTSWHEWEKEFIRAKELFGSIVGAEKDEVCSIPNTCSGTSMISNMVDFKKGSNVVVDDLEFHGNVYVWRTQVKKRGLELRFVKNMGGKVPLDHFESMVDDNTVIVNISHVTWNNGFRHDLKGIAEIAHDKGAYLVVDAAQSAGVVEIDVKRNGVDVLITPCYKWLLGPAGIGYMYVNKDLTESLDPSMAGWMSVTNPTAYDISSVKFHTNAWKYETGMPSIVGFMASKAGLEFIRKIGIKEIEKRILSLTKSIIDGLTELGFDVWTPKEAIQRAGIVNFRVDNPREIEKSLLERSIIVKEKAAGIRVSPYIFNTEGEVDFFIETMRRIK